MSSARLCSRCRTQNTPGKKRFFLVSLGGREGERPALLVSAACGGVCCLPCPEGLEATKLHFPRSSEVLQWDPGADG